MVPDSKTRIALVTGSNRGLGFETIRQLTKMGYRSILTSRDVKEGKAALEKLRNEGLETSYCRLDVTDPVSIQEAVTWVEKEFGRLDVLVNNAGIMSANPQEDFSSSSLLRDTEADLKAVLEVNFFGAFRVTKAMLPLLKRSKTGRIVNVSSGMGQLSEMGAGYAGYRLSKGMLNIMTRILAKELEADGIKVNSVCPGWVQTRMGGPNAPKSLEAGARGIVWAATLPHDGPTGGFFRDGKEISW